MMMHRQNVRPYIDVLEDLGVRVIDTRVTGSNHYRIDVMANGTRKFFIASRSSSDHRALQNFRTMVKRWKQSTYLEKYRD